MKINWLLKTPLGDVFFLPNANCFPARVEILFPQNSLICSIILYEISGKCLDEEI